MNRLAKFTYYFLRALLILSALYILVIEPLAILQEKGLKALLAYFLVIIVLVFVFNLYEWANKKMDEMEGSDGRKE